MNRIGLVWSVGCIGVLLAALASTARASGSDNFDSYVNGSNMLTNSNGQFSYLTPGPNSGPLSGSNTLRAVADGTAPSAPNIMRYDDNADNTFAGWKDRLAPASVINLGATGSSAHIQFDFKTLNGFNGRDSLAIRLLWSTNVNAGAEDWIDNTHTAGLSDAGLYFLDNGNVLGAVNNRYQTDTWYIWDETVTRAANGTANYTLDVRRLSDNFSLDGPISFNGATGPAGRPFLTGVGFDTSSNPNSTLLFDNLIITPEPAGVLLLLAGTSLVASRRQKLV